MTIDTTIPREDRESIRLGGRVHAKKYACSKSLVYGCSTYVPVGFRLVRMRRGTRDVATSLKDNAAREAVEAERKIAERKRGESKALNSKESFASKERPAPPTKGDKSLASSSKNPFSRNETTKSSDDLAKSPTKKPGKLASKNPKDELATAEWAGDSLDRRVKTVSGEKTVDDIDVAEPLLDARGREVVASDLFDESEVPTKKKSDLKGKTVLKSSKTPDSKLDDTTKKDSLTAEKAQSDSLDDHPWASKSPVVSRTAEKTEKEAVKSFVKKPLAEINPEELSDDPLEESSTAFHKQGVAKKDVTKSDQSTLDEAQQLEAKARVQSLLTQSKSFVNKGELRAAYRVAQQAQRVADSEDLYFTAGEEQPADVVRSVLMKIRFEENKYASHKTSSASEAVAELDAKKAKPGKLVSQTKQEFSNVPDGWTKVAKQEEDPSVFETPEKAGGSDSPWAESSFVATKPHSMQIKPGPVAQTVRSIPAFPDTQDQWRGVANEPMSLGKKSSGIEASGFESAQGAFHKTKVTHAAVPSISGSGGFAPLQDASATLPVMTADQPAVPAEQDIVSRAFPEKSHDQHAHEEHAVAHKPVPGSLASTDDWRNQDLTDIAVTRSPLLVAPAPPEEPSVAKDLAADVMDDSLGVDVQEPSHVKQPGSKLWLIFAAAAGACAMLFVRRRPAKLVRPAVSGR